MTNIIKNTEKVKEFMITSGQYIGVNYGLTKENSQLVSLRQELIKEELMELQDSIVDNNNIEILDALCDIEYVLLGAMITFGIKPEKIIAHDFELYDNFTGLLELNETIFRNIKSLRSKEISQSDFSNLYADLILFRQRLSTDGIDYDYLFQEGFDKVHESNMTKFCKTEKEAIDTCTSYKLKNIPTYYDKVNDLFVIKRSEDNKVLKSINYKPVVLSDLFL